MGVARAAGAKATGTEVEFMLTEDRECVAVEHKAKAGCQTLGTRAGDSGRALWRDAEAVATIAGRPTISIHAVPADAIGDVRGNIFPVERLGDFTGGVDDLN